MNAIHGSNFIKHIILHIRFQKATYVLVLLDSSVERVRGRCRRLGRMKENGFTWSRRVIRVASVKSSRETRVSPCTDKVLSIKVVLRRKSGAAQAETIHCWLRNDRILWEM